MSPYLYPGFLGHLCVLPRNTIAPKVPKRIFRGGSWKQRWDAASGFSVPKKQNGEGLRNFPSHAIYVSQKKRMWDLFLSWNFSGQKFKKKKQFQVLSLRLEKRNFGKMCVNEVEAQQ